MIFAFKDYEQKTFKIQSKYRATSFFYSDAVLSCVWSAKHFPSFFKLKPKLKYQAA